LKLRVFYVWKGPFGSMPGSAAFVSLCHARSLCSCRVVFALSGKNVNPTLFCDRFRVLATRVVVVFVLRICGSILWAGTSRDLSGSLFLRHVILPLPCKLIVGNGVHIM
jgi:hypothetical protein